MTEMSRLQDVNTYDSPGSGLPISPDNKRSLFDSSVQLKTRKEYKEKGRLSFLIVTTNMSKPSKATVTFMTSDEPLHQIHAVYVQVLQKLRIHFLLLDTSINRTETDNHLYSIETAAWCHRSTTNFSTVKTDKGAK